MAEYDYDMVVIGSGPAGQRAAVQAAKLGKRAAIVERHAEIGGVMVNTGTIPSKTLREAVMYLTGYRERGIYGESYSVKDDITMSDLMIRTNHVMRQNTDTLRHQLLRNRVELITADASFIDSHTIDLATVDGRSHRPITADKVVVAVGTSATKPEWTNVDGKRILLSDDVLSLPELPRSLAIIGAGVIGLEYGSIFATLGIRAENVETRENGDGDVTGTVFATEPVGSDLFLDISFEPAETEAPRLFKVRTRPDRVVKVGEAIPLGLPSDKIYLFDQGGRRVYPQ